MNTTQDPVAALRQVPAHRAAAPVYEEPPPELDAPAAPEPESSGLSLPTAILRFWLLVGVTFLTLYAYWSASLIGPRGQALCGIVAIIGLVALFSRNLAAVSWRP